VIGEQTPSSRSCISWLSDAGLAGPHCVASLHRRWRFPRAIVRDSTCQTSRFRSCGRRARFAAVQRLGGDPTPNCSHPFTSRKSAAITGSVKDKVVTFEFATEANGEVYHMVFTGTLADDGGPKGSIAVAGVEGTFTATKR
jgi:hypothetical protein